MRSLLWEKVCKTKPTQRKQSWRNRLYYLGMVTSVTCCSVDYKVKRVQKLPDYNTELELSIGSHVCKLWKLQISILSRVSFKVTRPDLPILENHLANQNHAGSHLSPPPPSPSLNIVTGSNHLGLKCSNSYIDSSSSLQVRLCSSFPTTLCLPIQLVNITQLSAWWAAGVPLAVMC